MKDTTLQIIRDSIHNRDSEIEIDESVLAELVEHAIFCLPVVSGGKNKMTDRVKHMWMGLVVGQVQNYHNSVREIERLTNILRAEGIIPVVLKGMSAAIYYDYPEYRITGDIDIILSPNTEAVFESARNILKGNGYDEEHEGIRHNIFARGRNEIELHKYFSFRESDGDFLLDKIIGEAESAERSLEGRTFYTFDDSVNGLIILHHIHNHFDEGLGFRQIIDWLMFARACLYDNPDETERYFELVEKIGLTSLAIHIQRLGELYFDMPAQKWSADADDETARQLFERICYYGNFGSKVDYVKQHSIMISRVISPRELQRRGMINWKAAQKHRALRPFAWVYQGVRYFRLGVLERSRESGSVMDNIKEMKQQNELLQKLGVSKYKK